MPQKPSFSVISKVRCTSTRFNQMAEADKRRNEIEWANFKPPPDYQPPEGVIAGPGNLSKLGRIPKVRGRKKKIKKIKDPNAPKRSMSAFFHFSQEERSKVRAANPEMTVGDVAKELSRRWNETPQTTKARFEELAVKDRDRYEREKQDYKAKLSSSGGVMKSPVSVTEEEEEDVIGEEEEVEEETEEGEVVDSD